eukprot:Hpha_TRINITY_DN16643_c1_g4::TRINITY_DN16643_c1_g4_i1::g.181932::m.181932
MHFPPLLLLPMIVARSQKPPLSDPIIPETKPQGIESEEWITDIIHGYGWRYYTVPVPASSFVDVIAIVHRDAKGGYPGSAGRSPTCEGLTVSLTAQPTRPDPLPFEPDPIDISSISLIGELGSILSDGIQHSALCKQQSSARVSLKDSGDGKLLWLMVQTRQKADYNATLPAGATPVAPLMSDCRFSVYVETRNRYVFFFSVGFALLVEWIVVGWVALRTYRLTQSPSWRWYGLTLTPADVATIHAPRWVLQAGLALVLIPVRLFVLGAAWVKNRVRRRRHRQQHNPLLDADAPAEEEEAQEMEEQGPPQGSPRVRVGDGSAEEGGEAPEGPPPPPLAEGVGREEEEEDDGQPLCRVCREGEGELVAPCGCQGSVRYVHLECLMEWRRRCARAAEKCELCGTPYDAEVVPALPAPAREEG